MVKKYKIYAITTIIIVPTHQYQIESTTALFSFISGSLRDLIAHEKDAPIKYGKNIRAGIAITDLNISERCGNMCENVLPIIK